MNTPQRVELTFTTTIAVNITPGYVGSIDDLIEELVDGVKQSLEPLAFDLATEIILIHADPESTVLEGVETKLEHVHVPPKVEYQLEATPLSEGRFAVRPEGQLGLCGSFPYPWTVHIVSAVNKEDAVKKVKARFKSSLPSTVELGDNGVLIQLRNFNGVP